MNGKLYCNCEHAQMLRKALEEAHSWLVGSVGDSSPEVIESAYDTIAWALAQDKKMRLDYEQNIESTAGGARGNGGR